MAAWEGAPLYQPGFSLAVSVEGGVHQHSSFIPTPASSSLVA